MYWCSPVGLKVVVVALGLSVPPTAKVIWRRDFGLKSHPKDWRSPGLNPRPLVYKASVGFKVNNRQPPGSGSIRIKIPSSKPKWKIHVTYIAKYKHHKENIQLAG